LNVLPGFLSMHEETPDVCIIELEGTVGEIESAPFIEAMRQLKRRAGKG
jgi:CTP synthase